jgi:hypothetical protein
LDAGDDDEFSCFSRRRCRFRPPEGPARTCRHGPGRSGLERPLDGALLVQADQRYETRNLRHQYTPEVARLLRAAHRWRQVTADRNDYCHLVEAVLNLEGDIHWAETLVWGVVSEEYELECPDPDGCASLWVIFGERGFFSAAEDYALSDDIETFPLHPADPRALEGLGRRLYDLALDDGHEEVARALTYAFGEATCPECRQRFSVVGQVVTSPSENRFGAAGFEPTTSMTAPRPVRPLRERTVDGNGGAIGRCETGDRLYEEYRRARCGPSASTETPHRGSRALSLL